VLLVVVVVVVVVVRYERRGDGRGVCLTGKDMYHTGTPDVGKLCTCKLRSFSLNTKLADRWMRHPKKKRHLF